MPAETITGTITFINHDKDYATIEYTHNGKRKTINGNISEREQQKLKDEKIIKKIHRFHVGDEVSFIIALSARGDKMTADCIEFRYNNALDNLINKSVEENRFVGYLKKVDEDYFVKETGSYIFFPLKLSSWEKKPSDNYLNEPYFFKLQNTDKPDKTFAVPFKSVFIPEYLVAMQYFKSKTPVEGIINKVTPYGIFINLMDNKIQAKLPYPGNKETPGAGMELKNGDKVKVIITYLGSSRIVVERV